MTQSSGHDRRKGGDDVRYKHELIEQRRREIRMTQAELARLTGMKQPAISMIEGGEWPPTLFNAWRIAKALGLGVDDFLEELEVEGDQEQGE